MPSCNLKLGATLGQGILLFLACTFTSLLFCCHGCIPGEFGVVYRGVLKSGFSDTIGDTVAVKTLRGNYETCIVIILRNVSKMIWYDE